MVRKMTTITAVSNITIRKELFRRIYDDVVLD
jgi:hypothetical protein